MAPRPLAALLRHAPLPPPDASVYRTTVAPWPATLTDRDTGTAISLRQWRSARDWMLRVFEARAETARQVGGYMDRPPLGQSGRIMDTLRVADEAALLEACTQGIAINQGRYTHDLSAHLPPVITHALRAALAEGRLWTPLLEVLFRRPSLPHVPLAYASRLSSVWTHRIEAWLATAAKPRVEELLHSEAPPILDRVATHVALDAWPLDARWRLADLGPYGTLRDLWSNASWTRAERVAFLADIMDRLRHGRGLPGVMGTTVPRARQDTLLFEMLQIGWESTDLHDLADPAWTARWLALLASGVLETLDTNHAMGRVLFQAPATPGAVIADALRRWIGTPQEHPVVWVANAHVPLAYVRHLLEQPSQDAAALFRGAARHPGAVRDPDLRARLLASRSKALWHLLWPHTPLAERGAYLTQFLKVAPLEALQLLVADPAARAHSTSEMVLPLFTHREGTIRTAAFQVLEHLQPGVHGAPSQESPSTPKLPIIRRASRRSPAP